MGASGLEPLTSRLSVVNSNQLSYAPLFQLTINKVQLTIHHRYHTLSTAPLFGCSAVFPFALSLFPFGRSLTVPVPFTTNL